MTDRRAFLTAALAAPVVISAPSLARPLDPVDIYHPATDAINSSANSMTDDEYTQVVEDLDAWEPPTLRDFLRKFIAQYGDGSSPTEVYRMQMVDQAKRLLG